MSAMRRFAAEGYVTLHVRDLNNNGALVGQLAAAYRQLVDANR
jgi:hypothetical protein